MSQYRLEYAPRPPHWGHDEDKFLAFVIPRHGAAALRAAAGRSRLFVFVHGGHGDHADTWTNDRTGAYWPQLVRDDTANFGTSDVATFDYASPKWRATKGVKDSAAALRMWLAAGRAADYDDVVFVPHSLGGVVVRQALVDLHQEADPLLGKIRLVVSMTGAYGGSAVPKMLCNLGSENQQFEDVTPGSRFLSDLNRNWETLRQDRNPPDERPYVLSVWGDGDRVVVADSAELGCDKSGLFPRRMDDSEIKSIGTAVHMDIVKPHGLDHPSHKWLREAFRLVPARGAG